MREIFYLRLNWIYFILGEPLSLKYYLFQTKKKVFPKFIKIFLNILTMFCSFFYIALTHFLLHLFLSTSGFLWQYLIASILKFHFLIVPSTNKYSWLLYIDLVSNKCYIHFLILTVLLSHQNPCAWHCKWPKLKITEFGVRKVFSIKESSTEKMGNLVQKLYRKKVQISGFLYVKRRGNGRGKRWLTTVDTWEPTEV